MILDMRIQQNRPWALQYLLLIAHLQIPLISAIPLAAPYQTTSEAHDPGTLLEERRAPPVWRSVHGVIYKTPSSSISHTADNWQQAIPVYQIGDGQVQAHQPTLTEKIYVTSLSTTSVKRRTATRRSSKSPSSRGRTSSPRKGKSSTRVPVTRVDLGPSTSTSTTTIFVSATPTPLSTSPAAISSAPDTPTILATSPIVETPANPASQTTIIPDNSLTSLTTSEIQTVTAPPPTNTTGAAQTSLETSGNPSAQPFPTVSLSSSATLSLVDTSTLGTIGPTATADITSISVDDIFQPIATDAPPPQIIQRSDHPVPRLGVQQQQKRLPTNKFYANFFLGDQTDGTWTHPYSLSWSKGSGQSKSWGLAISHTERSQLATGSKSSSDAGDWAFFASPLGIQYLVLSAVELGAGTALTTDTLEAFSVNVNLVAPGSTTPSITYPLVQGMAFVTGVYHGGTPLVESGIGIRNVTYVGAVISGKTYKYRALLADGFTWLIYVTPLNSYYQENSFTLISPVAIQGPSGFGGYIQIAKVPASTPDAEIVYDGSAGAYATAVSISGSVDGTTGTYTLSRSKAGATEQPLLIFALQHHVESLGGVASSDVTDLQLVTASKGVATAVRGDVWTLVEPELPISMSFSPWTPSQGSIGRLSSAAIEAINQAGSAEVAQNVSKQTNVGSLYYDGKALAKFAAIAYVLHELADNATLALTGLVELEEAFAFHVNNQQNFPLVYDTAWGGAVSIGTYASGNSGEDFGNTYYNDHHFHYGYFVYAAAIIGYLDPAWLNEGTNKGWVNMLVRDYANPVSDEYYPFSRSFDWYMGHSWAKGLFASADGKDQESSSEDTLASYALKMWGKIINDKNMEARGNLMLAIQARSMPHYFLYSDSNDVEPAEFIGNKVSGIMFENKIDHTTYFGNSIEYVQGIHMLPLMPMSTLIRSSDFVSQEWTAYNFGTYVSQVQGGWKGILMANLAIIDPVTSYNFFSNVSGDFHFDMLDGGASQTWYLAWSAALGGSPYAGK